MRSASDVEAVAIVVGHVVERGDRVLRGARDRERVGADVGRRDDDLDARQHAVEHDRERVRLLAGGAARAPHPDAAVAAQHRCDGVLDCRDLRAMPEQPGLADPDRLDELGQLGGTAPARDQRRVVHRRDAEAGDACTVVTRLDDPGRAARGRRVLGEHGGDTVDDVGAQGHAVPPGDPYVYARDTCTCTYTITASARDFASSSMAVPSVRRCSRRPASRPPTTRPPVATKRSCASHPRG